MKLSRLAAPLLTLMLAIVVASVFSFNAEARRMGGGKSFGRQSSQVTQRQATPPPTTPNTAGKNAANTQNAPANAANARNGAAGAAGSAARKPWAGMLGAMAAGLGLAWLAHALGLGAEFGNILMIALLVFAGLAVFRWLRRSQAGGLASRRPAYQGAGAAAAGQPNVTRFEAAQQPSQATVVATTESAATTASPLSGPQTWGIPAHFDVSGFTDAAKRNFRRLQDAWDRADIPTLQSMLSSEMLAEIQRQIAERDATATSGKIHRTAVDELNAQLLGIEEQDDVYLASVEFSGSLREDSAAFAAPFREVWNMSMPLNGASGWRVAGIQVAE